MMSTVFDRPEHSNAEPSVELVEGLKRRKCADSCIFFEGQR